jgi:hypothetical protein
MPVSSISGRPAGQRCSATPRSQSEPRIPFDNPPLERWTLSPPPEATTMNKAIEHGTSIRLKAPVQRPRDTDEFTFHVGGCQTNRRVSMTAHVNE